MSLHHLRTFFSDPLSNRICQCFVSRVGGIREAYQQYNGVCRLHNWQPLIDNRSFQLHRTGQDPFAHMDGHVASELIDERFQ